jgi:AcrR family transcriptional regulator
MASKITLSPDAACAADEPTLRERIMHAAFSLFMERGYDATSTLAIATRARVSKRDIYALFPHKRDILAVAIAERARRMRQPLDLPAARTRAALVRTLAAHGAAVLRELTSPEVAAVYRLAIAESGHSRELAEAIEEHGRRPNEAMLGAFLKTAQAAGLIGAGEPRVMVRQFHGLLLGFLHIGVLLRIDLAPDAGAIAERAREAAEALVALYPVRRGR